MLDGCETIRDCRANIPLTALKVSTLCIIHCGFYTLSVNYTRFPKSGHKY